MLMNVLEYKSTRAVTYLLEKLESKGFIHRFGRGQIRITKEIPETDMSARTVQVPLVGSAPCGNPVLAEENIEAYYPVSTQIARPPGRYFLLKAMGNSMNQKGIEDGNLVLFRQQPVAENGDIVVALIDGEATIKEFKRMETAIALMPRSSESRHRPIILTRDFQILGVVKSVLAL